jgi:hypothetical protein
MLKTNPTELNHARDQDVSCSSYQFNDYARKIGKHKRLESSTRRSTSQQAYETQNATAIHKTCAPIDSSMRRRRLLLLLLMWIRCVVQVITSPARAASTTQ